MQEGNADISQQKDKEQDKKQEKVLSEKPVNKFLLKALEAQREKQEIEPQLTQDKQEKSFPIDAENIIDESAFVDYSGDEAEIKAQKYNPYGEATSIDLFANSHIREEQKQDIDWNVFIAFCEENGFTPENIPFIGLATPILTQDICYLRVVSGPTANKVKGIKAEIEKFLCTFLVRPVKVQIEIIAFEMANNEELRKKVLNHPQAQLLMNEFGAELYSCYEIKHGRKI